MSVNTIIKSSYRKCDNSYEDAFGSFKVGTHDKNPHEWYMDFPDEDIYYFIVGEIITNRGTTKNVYELIILDAIHYKTGFVRYKVIPIGNELTIPSMVVQKGTQWRRV